MISPVRPFTRSVLMNQAATDRTEALSSPRLDRGYSQLERSQEKLSSSP